MQATLSLSDVVCFSKANIELKCAILGYENAILEKVAIEASPEEKVTIVFILADIDCGGTIDVIELAEVLCRLNSSLGTDAFSAAELAIEAFAGNNLTYLDEEHFGIFLEHIATSMNCSFYQLCLILVLKLAFKETGQDALQAAVMTAEREISRELLDEVRMFFAFDMMDYNQRGVVSYNDVVKHLQELNNDLEPIRLEEHMTDTMSYPEFDDFICKHVASPTRDVDEIMNTMTLAACRFPDEVKKLFINSVSYADALNANDEVADDDDTLQYGKMDRLYDLLDLDHDGLLDTSELALLLRKFQESKDVDITFAESTHAMFAADTNGDNRLDKKEFAVLILKFAAASGSNAHRLVDLLLMQTVMKDNSEEDEKYLAELKANNKAKSVRRNSITGPLFARRLSAGGPKFARRLSGLLSRSEADYY
eukprot:CAMPEP_0119017918 /NCGR_PEP_ID=MMETSP1176-20130426/18033_1 /TAXON_ID=265551 /ORGANISM="Synedropsis recta cf, Strain CCMP1620" /LENGTH=423 /DNA_ID=CAMNT_0006971775 /DNA_START=99 /DNA_END=1370 /DNA_ORIENTATION=-